ncbi:hypothetical protein L107_13845 [Cyanobium sp. Copco_Reservoir_LC18]|nr:hypothetical protein L107_13845 [Cyanobium sp. Copco_Reservoir_LC18]
MGRPVKREEETLQTLRSVASQLESTASALESGASRMELAVSQTLYHCSLLKRKKTRKKRSEAVAQP